MFKTSKWKLLCSCIPYIFPLNQIFILIETKLGWLPLNLYFILEYPIVALTLTEAFIARPFEEFITNLGWWSRNTLVVAPDGPLLPGSILVAVIYSLLIYIILSLISHFRSAK